MPECDLNFSPASSDEAGSYKLVELTPDLTSVIEDALINDQALRWTIKGHSNEDAVLCTADKTFTMRSVMLSNSVLVVTSVPEEDASEFNEDTVIIRDQLNEIIELAPVVPKLHKLSALIVDRQYDETQEYEMEQDESVTRFTYQDALAKVQSSEVELKRGLKEKRILILNNELRPIAPAYLNRLLELILTLLVSLSMKHDSASVEGLLTALADDHEVPRTVSEQVMSWFGEIKDGKWAVDLTAITKEVGLGILRNYRHEPISTDDLQAEWRSQVGDTFETKVSMDLLMGNYVECEVLGSDVLNVKYFPASLLPVDPAARFSELFLTRSRWKADEITPFLSDIAVNSKERDKLLLKYCRAVTDSQGVRYSARAQYSG